MDCDVGCAMVCDVDSDLAYGMNSDINGDMVCHLGNDMDRNWSVIWEMTWTVA